MSSSSIILFILSSYKFRFRQGGGNRGHSKKILVVPSNTQFLKKVLTKTEKQHNVFLLEDLKKEDKMARPVKNFADFKSMLDIMKYQRELFAYLLFDDRQSQKVIEHFADEQFDWLDKLAASSRIYFFFFLRRKEAEGKIENPSLEVAKMFRIKPNQLPGVVLFTLSDDKLSVSEGIYFPLKTKIFENDLYTVEDIFSDLFSLIQECWAETDNQKQLHKSLKGKIISLKRQKAFHPVFEYLKRNFIAFLNLPKIIVDDLPKVIVTEIARRVKGG